MAIYLDEDMVGADGHKIAFPHLLLCMGVVVQMQDGSLIGAHFTRPTTEAAILRMMQQLIRTNGSGMAMLYCMGNLGQHVDHHGGLDIHGKAAGLGFRGEGWVADFGHLKPTDGTYAEVTSNGAGQRATVRCRLNEHVTYTPGAGGNVYLVRGTTGEGLSTSVKRRQASKVGATAPYLSTPYLRPVTI